jgi:hypothetical protein
MDVADRVAMSASMVRRVLVSHGLNPPDHLDRVTRVPIRRLNMARPGQLVHVDIKKLGREEDAGPSECRPQPPHHPRAADDLPPRRH